MLMLHWNSTNQDRNIIPMKEVKLKFDSTGMKLYNAPSAHL